MNETLDVILKDAEDGDKFVDGKGNEWTYSGVDDDCIFQTKNMNFCDTEWPYISIPGLRPKLEEKKESISSYEELLAKIDAMDRRFMANFDEMESQLIRIEKKVKE